MREYGVPAPIKTAAAHPSRTGLMGLSKLSLGSMKLGTVHERIQAETATERSSRTDASHAEGGHDETTCGNPSCTAETALIILATCSITSVHTRA